MIFLRDEYPNLQIQKIGSDFDPMFWTEHYQKMTKFMFTEPSGPTDFDRKFSDV